MLTYLEQEANIARTENGAATYASTGSACLDLFATVGAMRWQSEAEIVTRFVRAYTEDPDAATKLLFFARDVRGGLGERRVFRVILQWLAANKPETVRKNADYIAEYGRFDDLLSLVGTPCEAAALAVIRKQLADDMAAMGAGKPVSLLAKWLPSINASNAKTKQVGKKIASSLGLSEAAYRKTLSALRAHQHIIENNLREKDYTFAYEKQPSRAMFKYRKAFIRNDEERYCEYIRSVASGKKQLHTDNVMPYELIEPYLDKKQIASAEADALNATWAALPNFGGEENAIAVVDTSGSMYWGSKPIPASVALSLGLYFAERNTGEFHNRFIEFSARPQLLEIKGETFADRLRYIMSFNEVANTNIEAVFDLILNAAVKNDVPQKELPTRLIFISDMEFDTCATHASATNFQNAKEKFAAHGYQLPQVVFWNVESRNRQQPVTQNEQGVVLVSGATPRLFSMVAGGEFSPYSFMMEVLGSDRYAKIAA